MAFRTEHERRRLGEVDAVQGSRAVGDESHAATRSSFELDDGDAKQGAHRRTQCLGARRIGGALRECDEGRPQGVGRTDQRADVAGIPDVPQREPDLRQRIDRQVLAPKDADHPRRMGESRDFREERRLDVLARDEQLDGLDACSLSGGDQILTLSDEEPEFVPPAAVLQLADELELLVLA
jgi:hypothetical protein